MTEENKDVLEIYKLYVEMADRVSARRASANNYLLTANTFLLSLYGLATTFQGVVKDLWVYVVPSAGILICLTWFILIESYRNLNSAKFKVIHDIEKKLSIQPFFEEWNYAKENKGKKYKPITKVEPFIPLIFMALYAVLAIIALCTAGKAT